MSSIDRFVRYSTSQQINLGTLRSEVLSRNLHGPDRNYSSTTGAYESLKGANQVNQITNALVGGSFDVRNNILSRRLMPGTPLAIGADKELLKALQQRVTANALDEFAPNVSFQHLVDGDRDTRFIALKKDYTITKPRQGILRNVKYYLENIMGIEPLRNPLEGDYSLRNLYDHTGKGQLNFLVQNLRYNPYSGLNLPGEGEQTPYRSLIPVLRFVDPEGGRFTEAGSYDYIRKVDGMSNTETGKESYIADASLRGGEAISTVSTGKAAEKQRQEGAFGSLERSSSGETRKALASTDVEESRKLRITKDTDPEAFGIKRGLLHYTLQLVKSQEELSRNMDQQTVAYGSDGKLIYKGGLECRSHTYDKPYGPSNSLIRQRGNGQANSVLQHGIKPRIHPFLEDVPESQHYMFSLENLAFTVEDLEVFGIHSRHYQRGRNGGRLMWFVPYGLTFSENSGAEYSETKFIGRPEPVYAYAGSKRTMDINFMLLIDHPAHLRGKDRAEIVEWVRCLKDFTETLTPPPPVNPIQPETLRQDPMALPSVQGPVQSTNKTVRFSYYFDNDSDTVGDGYEVPGLNDSYQQELASLIDSLNQGNTQVLSIQVNGYASKLYDGTAQQEQTYNKALSERRRQAVISDIFTQASGQDAERKLNQANVLGQGQGSTFASQAGALVANINSAEAKADRRCELVFTLKKDVSFSTVSEKQVQQGEVLLSNDSGSGAPRLQIEEEFTENLDYKAMQTGFSKTPGYGMGGYEVHENNIYRPAFNSYTPDDFYERVTFLQQCLRPGRSVSVGQQDAQGRYSEGAGSNSVFGRMPVCVLRMGDFFHTKVIIENINFDFNPNGDTLWDMNPEGRGLQPMLCQVNMTMKVLGGQSLAEPIRQLQNALSSNFYANATFKNKYYGHTPFDRQSRRIEAMQVDSNKPTNT